MDLLTIDCLDLNARGKYMNLFDIVPNDLQSKSISLESIGINKVGWRYFDIIKIIKILENKDFGILGGDVFRISDDQIEPTYDS
jgi:hypothetical protein